MFSQGAASKMPRLVMVRSGRHRVSIVRSLLLLVALVVVSPAMAGEGPEPPSAPTPDEANAAAPPGPVADSPGKADGVGADQAKTDSNPAATDAASLADAVRRAQENGSYKLKDGGMYEPPASRPVQRWNEGYGRT